MVQQPGDVGRRQWQEHLGDVSVPLTDPVPGLPEYARGARWAATPAGAGLDESAAAFANDMVKKLNSVPSMAGISAETRLGGGPNRYADSFSGHVDGHDFLVTNVSLAVTHVDGGYRPVAGSLCSVRLGFLLPLVLVNPRSCQAHMRVMTKPVKLGREDFDKRFEVRSGHVDYAVALLSPMADELLQRDDWAFFLEFANLVSVAAAPFATVEEVADRLAAMSRLVGLIPASVRSDYEVKVPPSQPDSMKLSPEDEQRARQIVDAMPADQRRALIARLRSEGPERVMRELLESDR